MAGTRQGALKAAETRREAQESVIRDLGTALERETYLRNRARIHAYARRRGKPLRSDAVQDWLHNHSTALAETQARLMELEPGLDETIEDWLDRFPF
jgi:hypothetical protein